MSECKKMIIAGLLLLNVAIVGGLLFGKPEEAKAAGPYKTTDYVVVCCRFSNEQEALVVLDLKSQKFAAWRWVTSARRHVPIGGRDLKKDFRKAAGR